MNIQRPRKVTMRFTPVQGPSAWTGSELGDQTNWVCELTTECRLEFERLVQSGPDTKDQATSAPDYPHLYAMIHRIKKEVLTGRGFAVVRGAPVEGKDLSALKTAFHLLGTWIGRPVSQNRLDETVTEVTGLDVDGAKSEIRGYQTRDYLPFHCDSCDVVALLCIRRAKSGGESAVVSSMSLYNEILANHREFLGLLYSGFIYDRRGEQRREDRPVSSRIPVFSYYQDDLSCRYVRGLIESAVSKSGIALSAMEQEALDLFDGLANRQDSVLSMMLEPGDIQFCNNHTMLHARTAYDDYAEAHKKRLLLRLWLNIPGCRNLAPDFVTRYADDGQWKGIASSFD
jgi:hypothetical protein